MQTARVRLLRRRRKRSGRRRWVPGERARYRVELEGRAVFSLEAENPAYCADDLYRTKPKRRPVLPCCFGHRGPPRLSKQNEYETLLVVLPIRSCVHDKSAVSDPHLPFVPVEKTPGLEAESCRSKSRQTRQGFPDPGPA